MYFSKDKLQKKKVFKQISPLKVDKKNILKNLRISLTKNNCRQLNSVSQKTFKLLIFILYRRTYGILNIFLSISIYDGFFRMTSFNLKIFFGT